MDRPVLILCPLAIEQRAARRAVSDRAEAITIGPGPDAIRRAFAERQFDPGALLVLFGVAGALTDCPPAPPINEIINAATGDRWTPTHQLTASDRAGVSLVGVDAPITSPAEKRDLHARTGASLVDTESHVFARLCIERNLAWAVVRGVSDTADESLPRQAPGWINDAGQTRTARVGADLLRSPSLAPQLLRLARSTHHALASASAQLRTLLDTPPERIAASTTPPPPSRQAAPLCSIEPPIPTDARVLLLFGGAFDPPHFGHIELPQRALEAIDADWIVYLPAARTPLRDVGPCAPAADRLAMLRLTLKNQPHASVCDVEIRRGGASYTLDTLRQLRRLLPERLTLRLLIGADQAANFHLWRQPHQVIALAEPVVMLRTPEESWGDLLKKMRPHWSTAGLSQWERRIAPTPLRQISSSQVREIIAANGPSAPQLGSALPQTVHDYIAARHLYGSR